MKLTEADFQRAAKRLKCSVPAIKAVAEVESRGEGFYADGFPVILFERHKFRKFTQGRYNHTHPHLSGDAGGYGKQGQNQKNKFNEAFALNPVAAMKSCSWGRFQIMGFNHEVCGYPDVGSFVDAMKESEGKQLDAFVAFVIGNKLDKHLRMLNWASFAEGYNGSDYKINRYDTKLDKAYKKYVNSSGEVTSPSATGSIQEPPAPTLSAESSNESPPDATTASPEPVVVIEKEQEIGFWEGIKLKVAGWWAAVGGMEGAKQAAGDAQFLGLTADTWKMISYVAIGIGASWLLYHGIIHLWRKISARWLTTEMIKANATPTNNVMLATSEKIEELEQQGYVVMRRK